MQDNTDRNGFFAYDKNFMTDREYESVFSPFFALVGAGVSFLACEDLKRMFDHLFPACALFFFFFF